MPKEKIFVHVGTGNALPERIMVPNSHERHIVFDPGVRKDLFEAIPHVTFHAKDARSTGLNDRVAHEVHLHNVLSDPRIDISVRHELLREAVRIAKDSGAIYVGNTMSRDTFLKGELQETAAKLGLNVEMILEPKRGHSVWFANEMRLLRTITGEHSPYVVPGAYLARLTKIKR